MAASLGAQCFLPTEKKHSRMNSRHRNLLFAGLMFIAFAAACYKVFSRLPDSLFAGSTQKTPAATSRPVIGGKSPALEAQFVSSNPGQAVHAPSLVELNDGSLRAVWFSGSREGAGDVTIQTAVLNMASQRWEPETTLFNRTQLERSLWRYIKKIGNPVIARAPDGSLHLWVVNVSLGGWAGSAITWSRSVDEGTSWSPPKRLVTSPFLNISTLVKGAPVAMADGSISLPAYHEFVSKFAEVLRLNKLGQVVDKTRIPASRTSLQPVVLAGSATQATAYMRSGQGGRVVTSSTLDAGKTWSLAVAASLLNPDSALAGLTSNKGNQWLALNPTTTGRESLALFRASSTGSFDAAQPFFVEGSALLPSVPLKSLSPAEHADLLGQELKVQGAGDADIASYVASAAQQLCGPTACVREFSYPFLLQTRDGSIHLVYTWHRSRIKHVRLGSAID